MVASSYGGHQSYGGHSGHAKCGHNLLVGCAPTVAKVPCQPHHGGYESHGHSYGHQSHGYQAPSHGYESHGHESHGYGHQSHGYEAPSHGYQAPSHGYQAPSHGGYEAPVHHEKSHGSDYVVGGSKHEETKKEEKEHQQHKGEQIVQPAHLIEHNENPNKKQGIMENNNSNGSRRAETIEAMKKIIAASENKQ